MPNVTPSAVKPAYRVSSVVLPLLLFAYVVSGAALLGWALNKLEIASFGVGLPMAPWTTVACIGLATSFLFAAMQRVTIARLLTIIPLAIGFGALAQDSASISLGIDAAFFPEAVSHQFPIAPGRPSAASAVTIIALAFGTWSTIAGSAALRRLTAPFGCFALAIIVPSGAIVPLGLSAREAVSHWAVASVPTTCALIAISLAIIMQRRHVAWPRTAHAALDGITLQWALLPCTVVPIGLALWQIWAYKSGQMTPEVGEIAQAAILVAVASIIIVRIWVLLSRERTARWAFSSAMDSAPVALTDINGRIIRWSKGCQRLYGWTAREARGQDKHALTSALLPSGLKDGLASDAPEEIEITERHRDGTRLQIIERRRLVRPRPDIEPMIVISMTDITQRHRAEQAMLASEARLNFAADLHELGLFEWSEADDKVDLSPQAERLFGHKSSELPAGLFGWHEAIRETFGAGILPDAPLSRLSSSRHAFRLQRMLGDETRTIEGSVFFYDRPGDARLSMLGIVMDVTEREHVTERLESQQVELRSILETVPQAMITLSHAGHVRSFSRAAEEMFGCTAAGITGQHISQLLPDFPIAAAGARTTNAVDRGGHEIPVEVVVSDTTIGSENVWIVFVRSLSEQIAAQNRLDKLREQLFHASRVSAMGEMGAGLAHELNQPLTATANFLGVAHMGISAKADEVQILKMVELANQEVLRAGEIIRRMRNFVAKGEMDLRACSLCELITDALKLARSGTRHAGVYLDYQRSPTTPEVLVDQIQIQQVLVNIINNALETFATYDTLDPQIIISTTEQADGTVLICVTDNGPGFPASIIDRKFEAFVSTRENGLGIGLSICRRIVEGHGGSLTFANAPEGGAVIEFTLPIHRRSGNMDRKAFGR
jgi:two-component system sensor kinase FixL